MGNVYNVSTFLVQSVSCKKTLSKNMINDLFEILKALGL
jgi:hypothetical protein